MFGYRPSEIYYVMKWREQDDSWKYISISETLNRNSFSKIKIPFSNNKIIYLKNVANLS